MIARMTIQVQAWTVLKTRKAGIGLAQPSRKKAIQITYAVCGALVVLIMLVNIGDVTDVGAGWGFWLDLVAGIAMLALGALGDRILPSN